MRVIDSHGTGGGPSLSNLNFGHNDTKSSTHSNAITTSPQDLDRIWAWNNELPPRIETCMHDIIHQVSQRQPNAIAVSSWDGTLTYRQVDQLSEKLAQQLICQGVAIGTRIPMCFEKSMWAVVSLLGVMKAGATFSLTDPSQPEARLRTIVEQTEAQLIITSVAQKDLGHRILLNGQVISISQEYFDQISSHESTPTPLPLVPGSSPLYIIFTSGSTGKPKGVVISHENYTSGALPRAEAVGYKPTSRCFDFPSYAFDVSIDCMLCTLANGGTVCVPSEAERMNDLSGAIRKSKANMVHMTPSVARVLDPDIIPSLDVLGLGGEAVSHSDAADWSQHTSLVIAYGPSECTVGCTINNTLHVSRGIGKGVGGTTWITDPEDHNVLMGVGEVGELLVEGPVVGIGYLGEPEKTAQVFIDNPSWLTAGHGPFFGRRGRLYKTGDLVRYESNNLGSIEFVGRKDQQVKIRGQRVELTEVEHHLQTCLPLGIKIAAEVIKSDNVSAPTLVAFLAEPLGAGSKIPENVNDFLVEPSAQLLTALSKVDQEMGAKVPRYMVPAAFITLSYMPSLVSGKTDRKKLREIATIIPRQRLSGTQSGISQLEEEPETEIEKLLARAWRKVLGDETKVYRNSNFFAVGGDSLRAMRLVAAARENGVSLTVADIFKNSSLDIMASKATQTSSPETTQSDIPAFTLLETSWAPELARKETAELCNIEPDTIEDIYPCTPLQEALMALSAKVKEAYVAQRVVELADPATADRLIAAFEIAQKDCPILRTRIVQVPGRGLVQVVVKEKLNVTTGSALDEYLVSDRDENMDLGKRLVRFAVLHDDKSEKINFVLTMHHALYDGWCMPLIVDRVNQAYNHQTINRPADFRHFIKYLCGMDRTSSETYWREQLQGANGPQFPPHPFQGYQAKADTLLEEYVTLENFRASNATVATIIRAAWAYVASQYINSEDVVFGETLTGRNAPVIGAEEIEGPMITTVPFRVHVDRDMHISEYLQAIQDQTVEQIPHEHFGLQHIRRLNRDALEACELKTGLVLHPSTANDAALDENLPANRLVPAGDSEAAQEALKFNTYSLMLVCSIDPKGFLIMASFDSNTIDIATMQRALYQFRRAAQVLSETTSGCVGDISCLTSSDMNVLARLGASAKEDRMLGEYTGLEAAYIVNPADNNKLLPVGAVGEVIVRAAASPQGVPHSATPSWYGAAIEAASPNSSSETRFFKTGILARFDAEGRLQPVELNKDIDGEATAAPPSQPAKRVSATSRRQRKLRNLWSRVLRISKDDIGLNDNFFLLGGDSIAAMKLVSEARVDNVKLTVLQMFQKRTLYEMANTMEDMEPIAQEFLDEVTPFSLLSDGEYSAADFVESVVRPQLAHKDVKVMNVLPTRPLQQIAVKGTTELPRYSARYELMYFDEPVDREHLRRSCDELVSRNEILRTVFVEHAGQGYGVVLEQLQAQFVAHNVYHSSAEDIAEYARNLCHFDVMSKMPLGSSFVKWFLVEFDTGKSCLIFRLSHAQYDEICLPILLKQLSALYENRPVPESIPYSSYVGHVLRRNIPASTQYWKDLLAGSSMSILKPDIPVTQTNHFAIQQAVDISSRPRDVTVATLPTAAWALCLARRLQLQDVTFGEVVSGRNIDFPHADAVTGPCWQYIPVRVNLDQSWTVSDLLAHIQHQHVASSAHEGIALSEIMDQCTDWPKESTPDWFDSVVHQDVAHVETLPFAAARSRMETVYPHQEPLREWKIQAFIDGDTMTLEIVTVESWADYARQLLVDLAEVARFLVLEPRANLFQVSYVHAKLP